MARDHDASNRRIHALYARDHAALAEAGALRLLEQSQQWNLAPVLEAGGVVVFPHATVRDCGHHVAATVRAVLDSGADRVVVISVLHAWTNEMESARARLAEGEDLTGHPLRGIQGPGLENGRQEWRLDHALTSWRYFWEAECARRGLGEAQRPVVYERYPFLAGPHPETLPGYEETARIAEHAVIVSTADPFHHGIGYGDSPKVARAPEDGGLDLARASIERAIYLLEEADYGQYLQHCVRARNDARDAGPLFRQLRGSLRGQILDVVASDMTELYEAPPPTWVAGALVSWLPG